MPADTSGKVDCFDQPVFKPGRQGMHTEADVHKHGSAEFRRSSMTSYFCMTLVTLIRVIIVYANILLPWANRTICAGKMSWSGILLPSCPLTLPCRRNSPVKSQEGLQRHFKSCHSCYIQRLQKRLWPTFLPHVFK